MKRLLFLAVLGISGCADSLHSGNFYVSGNEKGYVCRINGIDVTAPTSVEIAANICNKLNKDIQGHEDKLERRSNW